MKFSAEDYNILSYVLKKNCMSYEQVIAWAYKQYTNQGIDPFIEKIALLPDSAELVELIGNTQQVYGEPSDEFLAGETVKEYSKGKISLYSAICRILFELDLELTEDERQELYIAEDYFGWHDSAEAQASVHVTPFFEKYVAIYEHAVAKFSL